MSIKQNNEIQYNHTYNFTVNASFGSLPNETINKMFKDGRVASKFLENHLPIWFNDLEFVDATGYDHIRKSNKRKLDAKCFTKGGLTYAPSNMLGGGRKIVSEIAHEHANEIDYIACDVVDFPRIKVRFVAGSDLVTKYPNCKIKPSQRDEFFQ